MHIVHSILYLDPVAAEANLEDSVGGDVRTCIPGLVYMIRTMFYLLIHYLYYHNSGVDKGLNCSLPEESAKISDWGF